jgi:23S rRNA (guanosine2251-2'-O)-methyltransferase
MSPSASAHRKRKPRRGKPKPTGSGTETIYGRNAVLELLRAGRRQVHRLRVAEGTKERGALQEVLAVGRDGTIPIERAGNSNQAPLILLLDVLQDPQNVGTLMRTALAVGVHGVILPPRRSVGVTPGVVAASAGTCEHLLVATGNLVQVMDRLKAEDLWILGLEPGAGSQSFEQLDLTVGIGLVVGGESGGMRRLVRESCDVWVSLPMREGIDSLNAAVAGAIMLYTIWRGRGYVGAKV